MCSSGHASIGPPSSSASTTSKFLVYEVVTDPAALVSFLHDLAGMARSVIGKPHHHH
jgi:hypothetical protein